MKKTIVILTWNCIDYTKKCLDSLKHTLNDEVDVCIVDNGSTDGTVEYVRGLDWVEFIENNENLGFVKGNNVALQAIVDGDIILLNNDIIIDQEDWLDKLEACAYKDPQIGVVGCRLKNEKNEFLHAGTYIFPETFWGQQIGGGEPDIGQYPFDREVQGVVFACAYIKREVLNILGGLNTAFFSYFEDTDYCLRVWELGKKVVCCGDVTLIHFQNISTNNNSNVSFSDMFKRSQKSFEQIWEQKLRSRYTRKMAWHSIMNFPSGYAVSAKNFMLALDAMDIDIRYKYVYGNDTPFPVQEPERGSNYIANIIKSRKFETDCTQVVYGQGDVFYKNDGKYKIGFTMLETTGIPDEWVRQANLMDEVWVPSTFNVETFRNSGVKRPIYVIPLGIDPNYFNPMIKKYKNFDDFVFLSVFEWGERKAPDVLLRAFCKTFTKNDDVVLICKVINNDPSIDVRKEVEGLAIDSNEAPRIIFLHNTKFADNDMPTLYRSADCFVISTRGEGWGMPILEAMACGLPTIATNWSSQTDFFNEDNGYPVKVKQLIDAKAKCPYYDGFKWADPDEDHLCYLLRYVYEHKEEAKKKGIAASKDVLGKWTWEAAARKIINRLDNIG